MSLHNDIKVLQRSHAGAFIFEYYQNTLLPAAACLLLDEVDKASPDLSASLVAAWTHFYCHALPTLEAIFIHVKVKLPCHVACRRAFDTCLATELSEMVVTTHRIFIRELKSH
jgi:hypothetical protein